MRSCTDCSDKACITQLVCTDTVVVAERPAALARDHGLDVAETGVHPAPRHARRLRQQGHPVGLEHHLVAALVGPRLDPQVGHGQATSPGDVGLGVRQGLGVYHLSHGQRQTLGVEGWGVCRLCGARFVFRLNQVGSLMQGRLDLVDRV